MRSPWGVEELVALVRREQPQLGDHGLIEGIDDDLRPGEDRPVIDVEAPFVRAVDEADPVE